MKKRKRENVVFLLAMTDAIFAPEEEREKERNSKKKKKKLYNINCVCFYFCCYNFIGY